jgi:hypothetical protein
MRGIGNLCAGAEDDADYDARRLVGLLLDGCRAGPVAADRVPT